MNSLKQENENLKRMILELNKKIDHIQSNDNHEQINNIDRLYIKEIEEKNKKDRAILEEKKNSFENTIKSTAEKIKDMFKDVQNNILDVVKHVVTYVEDNAYKIRYVYESISEIVQKSYEIKSNVSNSEFKLNLALMILSLITDAFDMGMLTQFINFIVSIVFPKSVELLSNNDQPKLIENKSNKKTSLFGTISKKFKGKKYKPDIK